jgi:hypothetical protein
VSHIQKQNIRVFFIVSLAIFCSSQLQAQRIGEDKDALRAELAAQGFRIGEVVEHVPDFSIKGWKYLDSWNLSVIGAEDRTYMVTLQNKCYGLSLERTYLLPRQSKRDRLARNDQFLIKNQGRTVAHCKVKEVRQLDPID